MEIIFWLFPIKKYNKMNTNNSSHRPTRYWIAVASKDHVARGKNLGIVQANHGKASLMKKLKQGDYVLFYSPKLTYEGKQPYKKFTAIARVKEGDVYQGDMGGGFIPYRRDVEFLPCQEVDILPLIDQMSFI